METSKQIYLEETNKKRQMETDHDIKDQYRYTSGIGKTKERKPK